MGKKPQERLRHLEQEVIDFWHSAKDLLVKSEERGAALAIALEEREADLECARARLADQA